MKTIFIIDALNYLFRSYYAIRGMSNEEGLSTNALFGFIRSIQKLMKDFQPTHIVTVFDGPDNKDSRIKIYPEYKGHRSAMPEDLPHQIKFAKEYCEAAGIPHIELSGVEADDAMGAIAVWAAKQKDTTVYICSSDKDLCQIVSDKIHILHTFKDNEIIDPKGVEAKFGIRPDQVVDYLAIMGDSSDNIPGIKGFGAKTAADLLKEHGSLKKILDHPEILQNKKREEKIVAERENALISQKLASLQIDVPVPHETTQYQLQKANTEHLVQLFEKMRFKTLIKELDIAQVPKAPTSADYQIIDEEKKLIDLLKKLENAPSIAVDTETTSLNTLDAEIVGVSLSVKESSGYYIPFNGSLGKQKALHHLKPFLEMHQKRLVGHNIKFDMHMFANEGVHLKEVGFDTMIASYLLNSHLNRHNLEELIKEHFGHDTTPLSDLIGKKKKGEPSNIGDVAIEKVAHYAAEDADYTLRLKNVFTPLLEKRGLWPLFSEIEMPLLPILFKMERHGIYVDVEELRSLSKDFTHKISHIEHSIFQLAKEEFNLNSPKQLSEVLFEKLDLPKTGKKTLSGYSTGAEVLESMIDKHPIIPLILEYRSFEKLRSTYIDALPEQINARTKRIHCSFNQSGTATGRLSCKDPNLQNIPTRSEEGRKIRNAFKPETPNWSFVSLDYSQIELRIVAHMSEDPRLIEAFLHGEDIHKVTASQVFQIPLHSVTKEMRSRAKAVNFGIIYGQQAFGLSKELGIDFKEAAEFIDAYFAQYPKVKTFLEKCKKDAMENGFAKTLFGRERLIPEINSKNAILKNASMRLAVNSPIQGTQADIIKKAMIEVDRKILHHKWKSFLILQIHDELIFESPDVELSELKTAVQKIMENVISLKVPLKVDISVGKNWGEC
jgi:DNA polymerase-1